MPIINREKDASEQRVVVQSDFGLSLNGATLALGLVASPGTLDGIRVAAIGLTGAPTMDFKVNRFVVGSGMTSIAGSTTLTLTAIGTSGVQSVVQVATGNSLLALQAGDVLVAQMTGGANTGAAAVSVAYVLRATQDIKSSFGI
jgi:hypothetical protein